MDIDFTGKVVLVTGAGAGLGKATALAFARHGATLCIVDNDAAALMEADREVRALGARSLAITCDVSQQPACAEAVARTVAEFGQLDVLCNIAGIIIFSALHETTQAQWERIFGVNVNGPFYLCQAAMPHLIEADGAVINVASTAATLGHAYLSAYAATKGAIVAMTRSLAMEFLKSTVRINVVAPGGMETKMTSHAQMPTDADMALVSRFIPVRGGIDPAQMADFFLFLASDRARQFHGAVLSADAGATAG